MKSLHTVLPQSQYAQFRLETADWVRNSFKKSLSANELTKFDGLKSRVPRMPRNDAQYDAFLDEVETRKAAAHQLMKEMVIANIGGGLQLAKAGVTTALNYNFYDLRAPVQLSYPVNVPFRNSLPRIGRVNDGYGVAAHWKATRNPGTVYGGVSEGNRNQAATPDENDYTASYKEIGMERAATFTAQFAGEGYADNVADEHLRGLHELWLQEEGMMLLGNSGTSTGNNGFALGTAPTPSAALVAAPTGVTATLVSTTSISACVVCLTGMGNPANAQYGYGAFPSVANGLTPSYPRTNADGSKDNISGGISAVSAMSNVVTITSGGSSACAKLTLPAASLPVKGCFGYAWFVNATDATNPSKSNAYLYAITQYPTVVVSALPTGTQTAAATGLNVDNSFNKLDFDGLLTYTASTAGAIWTDLQGASLTSGKNGRVNEVETILQNLFQLYQAGVDEIWGSADAITNLDAAIRYSGTNASGYQFFTMRDGQNNLLGGFVVSAYQSRYAVNSPTGSIAIPIRIHPMVPPGTLFFNIKTNPYPHSRAPFVAGMLVQRDYYSIEWPLVARQWTFGTYVHEVLAHNYPWISAVLTGIGTFVGN